MKEWRIVFQHLKTEPNVADAKKEKDFDRYMGRRVEARISATITQCGSWFVQDRRTGHSGRLWLAMAAESGIYESWDGKIE